MLIIVHGLRDRTHAPEVMQLACLATTENEQRWAHALPAKTGCTRTGLFRYDFFASRRDFSTGTAVRSLFDESSIAFSFPLARWKIESNGKRGRRKRWRQLGRTQLRVHLFSARLSTTWTSVRLRRTRYLYSPVMYVIFVGPQFLRTSGTTKVDR